jgi:hypothetical protein
MRQVMVVALLVILVSPAWAVDIVNQWNATVKPANGNVHAVRQVRVDSAGGVVICAAADLPDYSPNGNPMLFCYGPNGNMLWETVYNDPTYPGQYCSQMGTDRGGNILLAGWFNYGLTTGDPIDCGVLKYSAEGQLQWVKYYHANDGWQHMPIGQAVDAAGEAIIAIMEQEIGGPGKYFTTIKYDVEGNVAWINRDALPHSVASVMAVLKVDAVDNIYLWCRLNDSISLRKYLPDGSLAWERTPIPLSPVVPGFSNVPLLEVDGAGHAVTTTTKVDGAVSEAALVSYDSDGNVEWVSDFGPGSESISIRNLVIDAVGNAFATAWSRTVDYADSVRIGKFTRSGGLVWTVNPEALSPADSANHAWDITVDASGALYTLGTDMRAAKYSPDGQRIWSRPFPGRAIAGMIRTAEGGDVYLAGDNFVGIGGSGYLVKYEESYCGQDLSGNVDCDLTDNVDISDLTALIDYLYISYTPLCCHSESNTDGDEYGSIDISDLTALIDHLYISFSPLAECK